MTYSFLNTPCRVEYFPHAKSWCIIHADDETRPLCNDVDVPGGMRFVASYSYVSGHATNDDMTFPIIEFRTQAEAMGFLGERTAKRPRIHQPAI